MRTAVLGLACFAICGLIVARFAFAQDPLPATDPKPFEAASEPKTETWSELQKSQVWANAKLAKSPRHKDWVTISREGRNLQGWVIHPDVSTSAPVVVVIHEAFGLTDSTTNTADEIAALGYIVIVPDMLSGFGPNGGGSSSFENSRLTSEALTSMSDKAVNTTLSAWADYGERLPGASAKFALVGLSWGGGAAFRYAAGVQRNDLKSVSVFYDVGPPTETQHPKEGPAPASVSVTGIQTPIYGFYASKDTRVMQSFEATREAMASSVKTFNSVVYDGADPAFMRLGEDPENKNAANGAALKASLARLGKILHDTLK